MTATEPDTATTGQEEPGGEHAAFQPAAHAAAAWWAQQIQDPVFRVTGDRPGERDLGAFFAETGMARQAQANPVGDGAAATFAALLETGVIESLVKDAGRRRKMAELQRRPAYPPSVTLGVDYSPDPELAGPAEAAGISRSRFPVKTVMWVHSDYVTASLGYGSPIRLVWSAEGWQRPLCDQMKPDDGDRAWNAHRDLMMCGLPRYHDNPCGDWIGDTSECATCGRPQTAHYTKAAWESGDRCLFKDASDA